MTKEEKPNEALRKDEQYVKVLSKSSSTKIHKMILEKYMKKSMNIANEIFEKNQGSW